MSTKNETQRDNCLLTDEFLVDPNESVYLQMGELESRRSSLSNSNELIRLTIPWQSCLEILQLIFEYYISVFPYRSRPLSIEYPLNLIEQPLQFHQSTSTLSIDPRQCKDYRTASTQTNSFSSVDLSPDHPTTVNEQSMQNTPKRRKFPFNRSLLPTSSLLTNFFRHSSASPARSSASSGKSSLSWGQRSSAASSSNQMRPLSSFGTFRRMESEIEPIIPIDRRSRASTSSSCLLNTTYRQGNHSYTHYHKPLSRQSYHSRSAHTLIRSPKIRGQQASSATNTNSSDSSSIIHRYHSRLFSTVSNQQRTRDDDIVAANERKALRVLMIIFCVFVTLWTPFFICTFISAVCEECRKRISPSVWFSITWLGYSSSMANPFIYTIFSDVFRRAFMNIIFCRSKDPFTFGHYSSKYHPARSDIRRMTHQPLSYRRSPNHEGSGASTPVPLRRSVPMRDSDGTVSINRYVSDTLR